jgi:membrane associated rhomboid family serine protease
MTLIIIAITAIISFLAFSNATMFEKYKFSPYKVAMNNEYVRFISHGFLHVDMSHLFFNMFSLYFAGRFAEQVFDTNVNFVIFYLLALVVSSLPDYFKQKSNPYYASVGASGAVSAVLFTLILFNPWGTIYLYFIPVPFIIYGVLYIAYSLYMSKQNSDNIGHMAHVTGAIFGIIAAIIYRPEAIQIFLSEIVHPSFNP